MAAASHVTTMLLPLTAALFMVTLAGTAGTVAVLPTASYPALMVLPSAATPRTV